MANTWARHQDSRPGRSSSRPIVRRAPRRRSSWTAGIDARRPAATCCGRPRSGPRCSPERPGLTCSAPDVGRMAETGLSPKCLGPFEHASHHIRNGYGYARRSIEAAVLPPPRSIRTRLCSQAGIPSGKGLARPETGRAFLATRADSGRQRPRYSASLAAKPRKVKRYSDGARKPESRRTAWWRRQC
jgi:hypothetical protein